MQLTEHEQTVKLCSDDDDYREFRYRLHPRTLVQFSIALDDAHRQSYPTKHAFETGHIHLFNAPDQTNCFAGCDVCARVAFPMANFVFDTADGGQTSRFYLCDRCQDDFLEQVNTFAEQHTGTVLSDAL